MDLHLEGRRALVTGGSSGIGLAVAQALLAEGADVAIGARGAERLQAAAATLAGQTSRRVVAIQLDTSDSASVDSAVQRTAETLGGVDILVNSAAKRSTSGPPSRLATFNEAAFNEDMDVKVLGYLRCARTVVPYMSAAGWGRIINVSGLGARQTGAISGSIRNVAVAALTKNLADELGRLGINVLVVHPGITMTELTAARISTQAQSRGCSTEEIEAEMGRDVAIGRVVTAAEVADVITFLASPRSVAMNGDAVVVSGGRVGSIYY